MLFTIVSTGTIGATCLVIEITAGLFMILKIFSVKTTL